MVECFPSVCTCLSLCFCVCLFSCSLWCHVNSKLLPPTFLRHASTCSQLLLISAVKPLAQVTFSPSIYNLNYPAVLLLLVYPLHHSSFHSVLAPSSLLSLWYPPWPIKLQTRHQLRKLCVFLCFEAFNHFSMNAAIVEVSLCNHKCPLLTVNHNKMQIKCFCVNYVNITVHPQRASSRLPAPLSYCVTTSHQHAKKDLIVSPQSLE